MRKLLIALLITACAEPKQIETFVSFALDNAIADAELQASLEQGADRWIAATCLPITINGGGVTWHVAHEPLVTEQGDADGLTIPSYEAPVEVLIADYVTDKDFAVAHEFGHRLGMDHNFSKEEPDLMSPRRTVNRVLGLRWSHISEQSLNAVCSVQDCGCFNPETGPVPL